jgi:DNA (cytosine-5)-methyltransferase 1
MNVVDLFAGCGGLSLGLQKLGCTILSSVEWDKDAAESYKNNHPSTNIVVEDIKKIIATNQSSEKLAFNKEVDLLCGGPPCQGFSQINPFRSIEDERNSLVDYFFNAVKQIGPKAVLLENVTGILTLGKGNAFNSLIYNLEQIKYKTYVGIIQAGSFGLPQNRWRVFVIALRNCLKEFRWPYPTHKFHSTSFIGMPEWRKSVIDSRANDLFTSNLKESCSVLDAIGDLPINVQRSPDIPIQIINPKSLKTETIFDHACFNLEEISLQRCKHIPPGGGWLNLPIHLQPENLKKYSKRVGSFNSRWGRLEWTATFPTIVTKPEPYWGRYIHPSADRVISIRECARAQGFPDAFRLSGPISSRYRQIGNAVPPPIAYLLGSAIKDAVEN